MSGGFFDYKQYQVNDLIEEMDMAIQRLDNKDSRDPESGESNYLGTYFNDKELIKKEMLKAKEYLTKAYIYTRRIDFLLSDDDGEESFHERLKEELEGISS